MKTIKILIVLVFASMTMASGAYACNEKTYQGDLKFAQSLQKKELTCLYNGIASKGAIEVFVPRCLGAFPLVSLKAFDETLTVVQIKPRPVYTPKASIKIFVETLEQDFEIACLVHD